MKKKMLPNEYDTINNIKIHLQNSGEMTLNYDI